MNKQELVDTAAKRLGVTKARAAEIIEVVFGESGLIAGELRRGGKVVIAGFGHFETRTRAGREVRNPRTGKTITLEPSIVPAFRPSRALKELVGRDR